MLDFLEKELKELTKTLKMFKEEEKTINKVIDFVNKEFTENKLSGQAQFTVIMQIVEDASKRNGISVERMLGIMQTTYHQVNNVLDNVLDDDN